MPLCCAGDKEVGDVCASNEQDEDDGCEQCNQYGADRAAAAFAKGLEPHAPVFVGVGMLALELRGDIAEFSLSLFASDTLAQSSHQPEIVASTVAEVGWRQC